MNIVKMTVQDAICELMSHLDLETKLACIANLKLLNVDETRKSGSQQEQGDSEESADLRQQLIVCT